MTFLIGRNSGKPLMPQCESAGRNKMISIIYAVPDRPVRTEHTRQKMMSDVQPSELKDAVRHSERR